MTRWLIVALVGALTLSIAISVTAQDSTTNVQLRVWQHTEDPLRIYVSARHEEGSWNTLGTIPLALDQENSRGTFRYGDITLAVPLPKLEAPTPKPAPLGEWEHFETENIDGPIEGYSLKSSDGRSFLVIRCYPGEDGSFLIYHFGTPYYLREDEDHDEDNRTWVRWRFSGEISATGEWWYTSDRATSSIWALRDSPFLKRLARTQGSLFMEVRDFDDQSHVLDFTVAGIVDVLEALPCTK